MMSTKALADKGIQGELSCLAACFVFLLAFSHPASAQNAVVLAKISELNEAHPTLRSEDAIASIMETATAAAEANGTCIPSGISIEKPSPITGVRNLLSGVLSGQVRNGWAVYANFEGCGKIDVRKYSVIEFANGVRRAIFVNSGRLIANMSISRDTNMPAALAAFQIARKNDPDCRSVGMQMLGTRIVAESDDLGPDLYGVRYMCDTLASGKNSGLSKSAI